MRKTSLIASAAGVLLALALPFSLAAEPAASASTHKSAPARQIDWDELLPPSERNGTANTPAPIHDYLGGGMAAAQRGSYDVNTALIGTNVKLPGFVVPLEMDANGLVREFFLVPYFGACIHVPPPPPNQIVYVKLEQGAKMGSIYEAQWITGTLRAETRSSRLGAAAYTLYATGMEAYKY